jgi:hypothetical protein
MDHVDDRLSEASDAIFRTPRPVPPLPNNPSMAELLTKYGDRWQIEIAEPASFIAIRRPTPTAQEILTGHSLYELARKLEAESAD